MADVAFATGDALRRAGIAAVLTGGACANFYSDGEYQSFDTDFVLARPSSTKDIDTALMGLGFVRKGDRYVHPLARYYVEFPSGPLGIGQDSEIRPVWRSRGGARTLALSPTDACRDRLAAFYHWKDRQALSAAVGIAVRNRVSLAKVHFWSQREGHPEGYDTFLSELRQARMAKRQRGKVRRTPSEG
ncbi:MAG: hypothetical protein ACREMY_07355 [bacterium]